MKQRIAHFTNPTQHRGSENFAEVSTKLLNKTNDISEKWSLLPPCSTKRYRTHLRLSYPAEVMKILTEDSRALLRHPQWAVICGSCTVMAIWSITCIERIRSTACFVCLMIWDSNDSLKTEINMHQSQNVNTFGVHHLGSMQKKTTGNICVHQCQSVSTTNVHELEAQTDVYQCQSVNTKTRNTHSHQAPSQYVNWKHRYICVSLKKPTSKFKKNDAYQSQCLNT